MDKITSLVLLSCARDDQGLYPAATVENGVKRERTPWQDGWNAACLDLTRRHLNLIRWFKSLPENQATLVASLAFSGVIEISQEDDEVDIILNMNDVLGFAVSDCETVRLDHLGHLAVLHQEFGDDGLIAYAATQRNQPPIATRQTAKFASAMARAGALLA